MTDELALLTRLAAQITDEALRMQILAVLNTVRGQIEESDSAHRADLAMLEELSRRTDEATAKEAYAAVAPGLNRNQQFRAFSLLASFRNSQT